MPCGHVPKLDLQENAKNIYEYCLFLLLFINSTFYHNTFIPRLQPIFDIPDNAILFIFKRRKNKSCSDMLKDFLDEICFTSLLIYNIQTLRRKF